MNLPNKGTAPTSLRTQQKFSLGAIIGGSFLGVVTTYLGIALSYIIGIGFFWGVRFISSVKQGLNVSEALFGAGLQGAYAWATSSWLKIVVHIIAISLVTFFMNRFTKSKSRMFRIAFLTATIVWSLIMISLLVLTINTQRY